MWMEITALSFYRANFICNILLLFLMRGRKQQKKIQWNETHEEINDCETKRSMKHETQKLPAHQPCRHKLHDHLLIEEDDDSEGWQHCFVGTLPTNKSIFL